MRGGCIGKLQNIDRPAIGDDEAEAFCNKRF